MDIQEEEEEEEEQQQQQQQQQQLVAKKTLQPPAMLSLRRLGLCLKLLWSKLVRIIASSSSRCTGGTCWSSAALSVLLLFYLLSRGRRLRLQKKDLMLRLLIQQKDQEISQLLDQLALMKEVLSARRSVCVRRRG
eukprot:TRINITY_DN3192_c2_g4_i1.p2 TRINITY_DN3192_c2_g4~~TRINITY_DN3192_c2_g4_i1.p2  ORF type:complete len:135 (+),score=24.36 TRINITY_DN3192_c2_g4_i1:201-605(+)